MAQEKKPGCQFCARAVEITKHSYRNAANKSKGEAIGQISVAVDEVKRRVGCSECPIIGLERRS